MKIIDGWLDSASLDSSLSCRHVGSPFYNERPEPNIDLLVIHNISLPPKNFGGRCVEELFTGCLDTQSDERLCDLEGVEVSSHLFIRRDGEIVQFVCFDDRAWHAGVSSYQGREACNDFSIGIEMEGADDIPYTVAQYHVLAQVSRCICEHYSIAMSDIVGHEHIAPGRKTDPGIAFDWQYYFSQMKTLVVA